MSLPDCSILLYIPYVDFVLAKKNIFSNVLLSNARKHGTFLALKSLLDDDDDDDYLDDFNYIIFIVK
jgi:hypothetical protein